MSDYEKAVRQAIVSLQQLNIEIGELKVTHQMFSYLQNSDRALQTDFRSLTSSTGIKHTFCGIKIVGIA